MSRPPVKPLGLLRAASAVVVALVVIEGAGCGRADLDEGDFPDVAIRFDAALLDSNVTFDATTTDASDDADDEDAEADSGDDGGDDDASIDAGTDASKPPDAGVDSGADASVCGPLQTECNGTCVNLQRNERNCGACGNRCAAGATCTAGVCACPVGEDACQQGARMVCADLQTTKRHCGTCATRCRGARVCTAGVCVTP